MNQQAEGPSVDEACPRLPDGEPRSTTTVSELEAEHAPETSSPRVRSVWKAGAAYVLYQALAFAIWVRPIFPRLTSLHVGIVDPDSRFYQWSLTWTPFAISHSVNPVQTGWVFAPSGVNLSWSAFIPGPALAMWPITSASGSLASLNLLLAAAPALAAWAAYLVGHRLTHRFWPSLIGGYLFGFSAYVAANMAGYVNLVLVFPIPLLVYLAIRHVEGSLGSPTFVAGFAAVLVALFSISTELFGTATIFGAVAYGGALVFAPDRRRRLIRTGALIMLAGVIAGILLLPYLTAVLSHTPPELLRPTDKVAAADLSSFVVPPRYELLGGSAFAPVLERLTEYPRSNSLAYVGVAVLVLVVGFAITERGRRDAWALFAFIGLAWLLSLGRVVHVGGRPFGWTPASLLGHVRIVQSAIPVRFSVYAALAVAVIASLWLARAGGRWRWVRWVVAVAAVVSLLPRSPGREPSEQVPAFLSSPQLSEVLRDGEIVYAIPGNKGDEMLWQATAGYRFALAEGYIGPVPPEVDSGPISHGLQPGAVSYLPSPVEFSTWIREHGVSAVILADRSKQRYEVLLRSAGLVPVFAGSGVSVWR